MKINILDPLVDRRWDQLVASHPSASVFHDRGWLNALARTYGYQPLVITTANASEALENGIVLCRVSSWITGTRLVSLPFSDHCEPLLENLGQLPEFLAWLRKECDLQAGRYVELRPASGNLIGGCGLEPSCSYWFHELDLRQTLDQLFRHLHDNSIRRKVLRAEREGLSYEAGQSTRLFDEFYGLLRATRRRHRLLPQPRSWFRNLLEFMGDKLQIRVARKNGAPIAAMLTLQHKSSVVYKYGCSDKRSHSLGGMPFLFWRLVEESKARGASKIDFGRTDLNNKGLIIFKDRFGTSKKLITYYRHSQTRSPGVANLSNSRVVQNFLSFLPQAVSSTAGRLLYRHMG